MTKGEAFIALSIAAWIGVLLFAVAPLALKPLPLFLVGWVGYRAGKAVGREEVLSG